MSDEVDEKEPNLGSNENQTNQDELILQQQRQIEREVWQNT